MKKLLVLSTVLLSISLSGCGGGGGNGGNGGAVGGDENTPPVATPQSLQATESETIAITLAGNDGDGDTLSFSLVGQPDNGSIQGTVPSISYVPNTDFIGTDSFTFKVNDGKEDSEIAEITIDLVPSVDSEILDSLIAETREQLNTQEPSMSNEEFADTEYSKNLASEEEQQRLNDAFRLIEGVEDSDPAWFATKLSEEIIIGEPGQSYSITANKLDINGDSLGVADFNQMRVVVRIQTGPETYEAVPENEISNFVELDAGNGTLSIDTPANLVEGRLLIGLRPALEDPAQNALAERWSAAIIIEIWPLKTNVTPLAQADVLFPIDDNASGLASESRFSLAEIKADVEDALAQDNLYLPLIVKGKNLNAGELLDYRVAGFPYGGKVEKITTKEDQQLILLSPAWKDIYEITDAENEFLKNQDILPKDVIYQNNEVENTPSTRKGVAASRKGKSKLFSFFRSSCKGELLKNNLSFTPSVTLYPFNASMYFSYSLEGSEVSCVWKAEDAKGLEAAANLLLMGSGGPVTIALRKLLGTDIEFKPHGSLKLGISNDSSVFLGVNAGWSLQEESNENDFKNSGSLSFKPANTVNNSKLTGDPVVYSGDGSIDAGIKFALNILSEDGVVGWAFKKLSIEVPDVGIKASTKITESLSVNAANAAAVYTQGESSAAAINVDLDFHVGASDAIIKAVDKLSSQKIKLTLDKKISLLEGKFESDYLAEDIEDDFNGNASVGTLKLKNYFLNNLFFNKEKDDTRSGQMGPEQTDSSIFEDQSKGISYELTECDTSPGKRISAPVIACAGPFSLFCGKSQEVELCSDPAEPVVGQWTYNWCSASPWWAHQCGIFGGINKGWGSCDYSEAPIKPWSHFTESEALDLTNQIAVSVMKREKLCEFNAPGDIAWGSHNSEGPSCPLVQTYVNDTVTQEAAKLDYSAVYEFEWGDHKGCDRHHQHDVVLKRKRTISCREGFIRDTTRIDDTHTEVKCYPISQQP